MKGIEITLTTWKLATTRKGSQVLSGSKHQWMGGNYQDDKVISLESSGSIWEVLTTAYSSS